MFMPIFSFSFHDNHDYNNDSPYTLILLPFFDVYSYTAITVKFAPYCYLRMMMTTITLIIMMMIKLSEIVNVDL